MVEFAVGDLYDAVASRTNGAVINPTAFYECKYCPMFQVSGTSLRDSDRGRAHAAAHRIAFEALLEPSPVLICPICDLPQKTSEVACVFGCMFNDLDLVEHLEQEHGDTLRDEMVCDFSDPRYLFTTFREIRSSLEIAPLLQERISEVRTESTTADDDSDTIVLSDGDAKSNASSDEIEEKCSLQVNAESLRREEETAPNVGISEGFVMEIKAYLPKPSEVLLGEKKTFVAGEMGSPRDFSTWTQCQAVTSGGNTFTSECNIPTSSTVEHSPNFSEPSVTQGTSNNIGFNLGNEWNTSKDQATITDKEVGISQTLSRSRDVVVEQEPRRREQMDGVSFIACLICEWAPKTFHDPRKMREEISLHVRSHIREEANKLPGRTDASFADQRLLSCMDFSLEEYFEKEHLTDLSGTINSRIMERVYSDLLTKLFGICVPVVYRILHGNNGNPFRAPEALRKKRKARSGRVRGKYSGLWSFRDTFRSNSNSTETTESSDADSSARENDDLPGIATYNIDQHIQCARAECGHSLLTPTDRMAIVHHIASHIRHDESRLLSRAGASPVVACDCGATVGSPMGYVYHIVHDHVFEHRQFSEIAATIVSYLTLIVETAIESVLAVRLDFRSTKWTLWCAYFCLEDDEGEEQFFADSTDLNEHWLKLWEDFTDESMIGKIKF
ncbi:unnamed protein product [Strongylus vulgaris]|uniref:Uncharacterized protein n=1 Tax=Strongylus vulgaris TaxID=40348 RepID=A0A3P7I6J3_STRVU|nr:unnamed protein product [Strongylus vulgaris]